MLPGALAIGALIASAAALQLDRWATVHLPELPWFVFSGNSDDARQLLGTLAGSMVSLTTITFSVTMIVLTLASNQFGPRVLRNFLRDHFNQVVLGTFVATLLYCLLLLGQLPSTDTTALPRIAITLAVLFTVICLFALLGFVHHTAKSIQTSHVVKHAAEQLDTCVEKLFPHPIGEPAESPDEITPPDFKSNAFQVTSSACGYLQAIDLDNIMVWAKDNDFAVKICRRPGDFITSGDVLLLLATSPAEPDTFTRSAQTWFFLGNERTGEQDTRYGFRQLVEIAVRALSPGTNDPFTAINAIDYIGCALAVVAQREPVSPYRLDDNGTLRIIAQPESFPGIAEETFSPLRCYGKEHPLVIAQLWKLLDTLSSRLSRTDDRAWVDNAREELREIINAFPEAPDQNRLQSLTD